MTKKQIAYFMSFLSFRLLLALVGILVGLLIARWIWGRFVSSWMDAENEIDTLRKDIADQQTKNCKLRRELDAKLESSGKSSANEVESDWYSLDGVDQRTVQALKAYGLSSPAQLNSLSANEQTELKKYLQVYGLELNEKWIDADSVANEKDSQSAETNSAGAVGFVSDGNAGSSASPPMPKFSSDVKSTATVREGAGFVESQDGREHGNNKAAPQQSGGDSNGYSESEQNFDLPPVHGPKLDWGELEGVDPKLAGQLDEMGIRNINQLEAMSYEQRKVFESKLESNGSSWNWNWLRGWKAGLAESHGKQNLAAAHSADNSERGTDSAGFAAVSSDNNNNGGGDSAGTANADASSASAEGTVSASTTSSSSATLRALNLTIPQAIGPDTDWSELSELDPKLKSELDALGVRNVDQLASLSFDDRRKLERHFSIKNVNWDWQWLEKWRSAQEGNADSDGAAHGASTGGSVESTTDKTSADVSTKGAQAGGAASGSNPSSPNPVYGFATGRRDASASSLASSNTSSAARSTDPNQTPVLFTKVPEFRDDLTLLDGIDGPQSIELRRMGIYNFSQLHNLPIEDRARLQSWFRKRGWHLDMDQWRIASEGNTLNPSIEDIQQQAFEVYQHRVYHDLCGGERTDWEQAEWKLRGNPIFELGVPHDVDDFAVSLTGISPEVRDELYRMGLYNRHQINALDNDARRLLTRWFAGPRFGVDLTQAFGWLSSLKELPAYLNFGQVFAERPRRVDDLSLINGLEPSNESDLNRIGIYQFEQIANWSHENILAISEALKLDDSIIHENWIAQAKRMI